MQKKYIVRLSREERNRLREVVRKLKGTGQKVRRAQILLRAAAGRSPAPYDLHYLSGMAQAIRYRRWCDDEGDTGKRHRKACAFPLPWFGKCDPYLRAGCSEYSARKQQKRVGRSHLPLYVFRITLKPDGNQNFYRELISGRAVR